MNMRTPIAQMIERIATGEAATGCMAGLSDRDQQIAVMREIYGEARRRRFAVVAAARGSRPDALIDIEPATLLLERENGEQRWKLTDEEIDDLVESLTSQFAPPDDFGDHGSTERDNRPSDASGTLVFAHWKGSLRATCL